MTSWWSWPLPQTVTSASLSSHLSPLIFIRQSFSLDRLTTYSWQLILCRPPWHIQKSTDELAISGLSFLHLCLSFCTRSLILPLISTPNKAAIIRTIETSSFPQGLAISIWYSDLLVELIRTRAASFREWWSYSVFTEPTVSLPLQLTYSASICRD